MVGGGDPGFGRMCWVGCRGDVNVEGAGKKHILKVNI